MMRVIALGGIVGIVAGLRSMTAPAVVSAAARGGWLPLERTPFAFMASPWAAPVFGALAAGELAADKVQGIPPRTSPAPLLWRLFAGGLAGAAIGEALGRADAGLAAGVAGAALGSVGGLYLRRQLTAAVGPAPAALMEDVLAVGAAIAAVDRARA